MIVDTYLILQLVGYPIAILLNVLLLILYFIRPLKMNSSRYFIPITAAQNVAYSMCAILLAPVSDRILNFFMMVMCMFTLQRVVTWKFCWVYPVTGVLSGSLSISLLLMVVTFLVFLMSVLTSTNSLFHTYLLICRLVQFDYIWCSSKHMIVLGLCIATVVFFVFFQLWNSWLCNICWQRFGPLVVLQV